LHAVRRGLERIRGFSTTMRYINRHYLSLSTYVLTIKDSARRFVLLKLTTDRHETSRGLSVTPELLVVVN